MQLGKVRAGAVAAALLVAGTLAGTTPASAVIGGTVAGYAPWAVRMVIDGRPSCTGTAVSDQWILSASHCFFDLPDKPFPDAKISFRVGNLDQRKGTVVHPIPGSRVEAGIADMMLIKVTPMRVRPAALATSDVAPGQVVRDYGWGATCHGDENSCQSDVLRQTDLTVLAANDPRCAYVADTDFCLARGHGIPAGGDSGGPVVATGPQGRDTLVGVFDESDRDSLAAAGSVAGQRDWIRSVIGR